MKTAEVISMDMLEKVSGGESGLIKVDVRDCKKHPWYYGMVLGWAMLYKGDGLNREQAIKAVEEKFRKEYFSEITGVEELVTQELWDSWVHRS